MTAVRQQFEDVRFVRLGEMKKGSGTQKSAVLLCLLCRSEFEVPLSRWNNYPAKSCKKCSVNKRRAMISQSMKVARAGG